MFTRSRRDAASASQPASTDQEMEHQGESDHEEVVVL